MSCSRKQLGCLAERSTSGLSYLAGRAAALRYVVCFLLVVSLANIAAATVTSDPKNILILYSFSERKLFDPPEELEKAIKSRIHEPVNYYIEYLESQRFEDPAYEKSISETLISVYRKEKIDLVIVVAYPALAFAVRHRDEMFPGVPIVFSYVHASRFEQQKPPPGVTGVTVSIDVQGTVDLALRLHSGIENVAVVTGASEFHRYWLNATRKAMMTHPTVKVIEIQQDPQNGLGSRLASLPPHTVVLFELVPLGSTQIAQGVFESLVVTGHLFPTYCMFRNYCVGRGGTIGVYPNYDDQTEHTSEIVARIFSGEGPDSIRMEHDSGCRVYADWRELRRWNIQESALPTGGVVLYREPTIWERYEKYLIAGVALVVLQTLLIISLFLERAQKRKAEMVLTESERRFRLMADSTPSLIWMCDDQAKVTYLNEQRRVFTGEDAQAGFGDSWKEYVHPDDLDGTEKAIAAALKSRKSFSREYRLRRRDGTYRWMLDIASPRFAGNGVFTGFIGSAVDVTDQKLAEEALKRIGGKLIEVQEQERSRIARELHDDICQRLILLSMEIEQVNRGSEESREKESLIEIQRHCSLLAGDVQLLSHQLHSSKLEYLGLSTALRSFIREFSKQHHLTVAFTAENVPKILPADISLCFFRIGQEALQNARKYSGVSEISVELEYTEHELRMEVSDAGVGFDVDAAKKRSGLGLVSMEERVNLVNGTLSVETGLNKGTSIVVCVPLPETESGEPEEGRAQVEGKERDHEANTHLAGR